MGDINQYEFARRHRDLFRGPVLEVGSKDYGNTQDLRSLLGIPEYVGIDMESGPGVDQVLDLTADFAEVDHAFGGRRFRTVFCLSVLEHVSNPFRMCDNITRLLVEHEAVVYVSVPLVWEIHAFPSDYWRFTPEAVKLLFPALAFPVDWSEMTTPRPSQTAPLTEQPALAWLDPSWRMKRGQPLYALRSLIARLCVGTRKVFSRTMINMIAHNHED